MHIDLNALLTQIGKDKGIDKSVLIEAVESAVLSAARKQYGHNLNLETQFDEERSFIEVLQFKTVVDAVEDDATQISVNDARKEYDSEAIVGDEFGKKLDTSKLGRIAAQTAKQVIVQRLREAEREVVLAEFEDKINSVMNSVITRIEGRMVRVEINKAQGIMPPSEQIRGEHYHPGQRLKVYLKDVERGLKGAQLVVSRGCPEFVQELFRNEVPEMEGGAVEIKGIVREAGVRSKIAVASSLQGVDPVGTFVGGHGTRVQAVMSEVQTCAGSYE